MQRVSCLQSIRLELFDGDAVFMAFLIQNAEQHGIQEETSKHNKVV
jgi:hypothetical protein